MYKRFNIINIKGEDNMSKIIINTSTSYQAEAATKALLSGGFIAKKAYINYNLKKGVPLPEEVHFQELFCQQIQDPVEGFR